jgi:hypothetical protein
MCTGDSNDRPAIYRSACCDQQITVPKNGTFPECIECGRPTTWIRIQTLVLAMAVGGRS